MKEAAGAVERLGMRIADDVQDGSPRSACEFRAMVDQTPAYSLSLQIRLDKQTVQLDVSIVAQQHSREAGKGSIAFGHEHMTGHDLLDREYDSIGVREQRFAVAGIG